MKKFLVMLMVVAMASFLFVGCNGTTPPIDPVEPEPTPTPATVAPIITSVPDIVDGYINKARAADGLVVNGTAPTYSEVKVYINGLTAGTGDTTATGAFSVVVANADLIKAVKGDGAKTLNATATEDGLAESASSNQIKFTLDTELPTIVECSAKAGSDETFPDIDEVSDSHGLFSFPPPPFLGWLDDADLLVEGTWIVQIVGFASPVLTLEVTDPSSDTSSLTIPSTGGFGVFHFVPGVNLGFIPNSIGQSDVGAFGIFEVTCAADAVPGYIDVTFDDAVTGPSLLAGPWTAFGATEDLQPTVAVRSATTARLTETVVFRWFPWPPRDRTNLAPGVAYAVSCSGITDLAGNSILASSPESCTGVVMP